MSHLILTEDTRAMLFTNGSTRSMRAVQLPIIHYRGVYAKAGATNTGSLWRKAINEAIARRLKRH